MAIVALAWLLLGVPSTLAQLDYHGRTMAEWENDLTESVTEVRRRAARALAHFGARAVPTLVQALEDREPSVRSAAIRALGRIGPEARDALPALVRATEDENDSVREAAAKTLGRIRGN
jgi:HEAT repeat protein